MSNYYCRYYKRWTTNNNGLCRMCGGRIYAPNKLEESK